MSNSLKPTSPGDYVVLLYHGVYADGLDLEGRNSSGKHISAGEFDRHMAVVARDWNVVSMLDIAAAHLGKATLPPRSVAVTIDDGLADVYHNAWPALRRHGLRATFYLTTGFVDSGRVSWTDQLEIMILGAPPGSLEITLAGERLDYHLDGLDGRVDALTQLKKRAKHVPFTDVQSLVRQVEAVTGVEPVSSHPLYEIVSWDQVREMADDECFDLGAHTVDHIPLARMPFEEMSRQVTESLARVSEQLGEETRLFSYPEGQAGDFDEQTIGFLKASGLDMCPTAIEGVNNVEKTDPFHIYRCMVGFENRPFILA